MSFTSLLFIPFIFIVFLLYYLFKNPFRYFILLLANIFFLFSFIKYHFVVVLIFAFISYFLAFIVKKHKIYFVSTIVLIVLLFIGFKYINYFNLNLIVPLGLSFYSFKIISYLSDIYQGKIKPEKNILLYLNYILFFPTFISGPISRAEPFMLSLKESVFDYNSVRDGAFLCACGIFEKVVIADYFGIMIDKLFNNDLTGSFTLMGILLYALYIYVDFDSYSNIAIGAAKILAVDCGINFKTPYLAHNIKEFWHRWHISLSTWFKDYVYIPLGGNKKSNFSKYFNTVIVFVLSGIWHGTTLNFLIWGLGHGVLMVFEDIILNPFKNTKINFVILKFLQFGGVIINYLLVAFLFVFFKFVSFDEAVRVINKVFIPMKFDIGLLKINLVEWYWFLILIALVIIIELIRYNTSLVKLVTKQIFIFRWSIYILMIAIFLVFGIYGSQFNPADFIYKHF